MNTGKTEFPKLLFLCGLSTITVRLALLLYFEFLATLGGIWTSAITDRFHHYQIAPLLILLAYVMWRRGGGRYLILLSIAIGLIIEEHIVLIYETIKYWDLDVPYMYLSSTDNLIVITISMLLMISSYLMKHLPKKSS